MRLLNVFKTVTRRIEIKIVLYFAIGTLIVSGSLTWNSAYQSNQEVRAHLATLHQALSVSAASSMASPLKMGFSGTVQKHMDDFITRSGDNFQEAAAFDALGTEMARGSANPESSFDYSTLGNEISLVSESLEPLVLEDGLTRITPALSKKGALRGVLVTRWSPQHAMAQLLETQLMGLAIGAAVFFGVVIAMGIFLSRTIGRGLSDLEKSLNRLGNRDFEDALPMLERRDQIGDFARQLDHMRLNLQTAEFEKLQQDRAKNDQAQAVEALRDALIRLHDRDLTVRIDTIFSQEYEALRQDFNGAVDRIDEAFNHFSSTAHQLETQMEQTAQAVVAMTRASASNAETIQENTAYLDELAASVLSTTERTRSANGNADTAEEAARISLPLMQSTIEAMDDLESRSDDIVQVLDVIDDIAFQTSLLSLNAGVEASRAGSKGKGFAVVAVEVQNLSKSAAAAAQRSRGLVTSSDECVRDGVSQVRSIGDKLKEIVTGIEAVSGEIGAISNSSETQSKSIQDFKTNMNALKEATQSNAVRVSQTQTSLSEMTTEFQEMTRLLNTFRSNEAGNRQQKIGQIT